MSANDLARLRQQHVGRLLLQAQRAFNARAVAKLHERGYLSISLAHLTVLPNLDADGTRVTTMAERAGITKQGMGQVVRDLEMLGYLIREEDPTDRRAALVRFTPDGRQLLADAVAVTGELESDYTELFGSDRLDALRQALQIMIDADDP